MARKSSHRFRSRRPCKRPKRARSPIPEPFQVVSSATVTATAAKIKVPMLVLYGEWLKAIGFPIGSAAVSHARSARRTCVTSSRSRRAATAPDPRDAALSAAVAVRFREGGLRPTYRRTDEFITGENERNRRSARAACTRTNQAFSILLACVLAATSAFAASAMPTVKVEPLAGAALTLPADLPPRPCVFVVGFSKASREQTMQWSQRLDHEALAGKASMYSVAVLEDVPALMRRFVIGGIRKGVPDALHDRFLVATSDAAAWKDAVSNADADAAYLILVNAGREIVSARERAADGCGAAKSTDALNAI